MVNPGGVRAPIDEEYEDEVSHKRESGVSRVGGSQDPILVCVQQELAQANLHFH